MTSILIRPRTAADLDDCVRLLAKVHASADYPLNWPSDPADWLSPPALGIWVLTVDQEVAGHLVVTADGSDSAMVERLFVDPQRTGAGLGRQLLDYAITFAQEEGRHLILDVVDSRQATADFYRKAGWREAGRIPITWGGDQATHLIRFEAPLASA